jgi:hypothetical protein
MKDAGGAIKFVGASESSVALAESFDRLLVIGYLGFDVPVYPGGDLGVPIPTFQRLTGGVKDPPRARVKSQLTLEQARFVVSQDALNALAKNKQSQAVTVISNVLSQIKDTEFDDARADLEALRKAQGTTDVDKSFESLLKTFRKDAQDFVTVQGDQGPRYAFYDQVFALAYDKRTNAQ